MPIFTRDLSGYGYSYKIYLYFLYLLPEGQGVKGYLSVMEAAYEWEWDASERRVGQHALQGRSPGRAFTDDYRRGRKNRRSKKKWQIQTGPA